MTARPSAPDLAREPCASCRADSPGVADDEAAALLETLSGWQVVEANAIKRLAATFAFDDFATALAFVNRVGALAEAADHHPRMVLEWGRVEVAWWTHTIGGLHRNDFIMAARCSEAYAGTGARRT